MDPGYEPIGDPVYEQIGTPRNISIPPAEKGQENLAFEGTKREATTSSAAEVPLRAHSQEADSNPTSEQDPIYHTLTESLSRPCSDVYAADIDSHVDTNSTEDSKTRDVNEQFEHVQITHVPSQQSTSKETNAEVADVADEYADATKMSSTNL